MLMRHFVLLLLALTIGVSSIGCERNISASDTHKATAARQAPLNEDVADAAVGAPPSVFATGIGGAGTNNKGYPRPVLKLPTVCDNSSFWDFPLVGTKDGYQTVTQTALGNGQIHVCSYAIMNGANPQDVSSVSYTHLTLPTKRIV